MNGGPARRGLLWLQRHRTVGPHARALAQPAVAPGSSTRTGSGPRCARRLRLRAQAPLGTHRRRATRTDSRPARAGSGSMRIGSGSTDRPPARPARARPRGRPPRRGGLGRWHRDACGCIRDRASRARHRRAIHNHQPTPSASRQSSRNSTSTTNVIAHRTVPTATVRTPSTSTGRTAGGPKPCRRRRGMVMRLAVARRPLQGEDQVRTDLAISTAY